MMVWWARKLLSRLLGRRWQLVSYSRHQRQHQQPSAQSKDDGFAIVMQNGELGRVLMPFEKMDVMLVATWNGLSCERE